MCFSRDLYNCTVRKSLLLASGGVLTLCSSGKPLSFCYEKLDVTLAMAKGHGRWSRPRAMAPGSRILVMVFGQRSWL